MRKLVNAFNAATIDGLMCRSLIRVDWRGNLYDCDFNQMHDLTVERQMPQATADFDSAKLSGRNVVTGALCFGCTAGSGSSCGGAVADT